MLYNFSNLKKLFSQLGIPTEKQEEKYLIVEGDDFQKKYSTGKIVYRDNGIFEIIEGKEYQRYIYKKYYSVTYGQTKSFPKFHFLNCKTVKEYGINNYYSASTPTVLVIDNRTGVHYKNQTLDICKNCLHEAIEKPPQNTIEFFESITKKQMDPNIEEYKGINGYILNWPTIRKNYLIEKGTRCQNCNWEPAEKRDQKFLEIHHIDHNKSNNSLDNLEGLCVLCHAYVDELHKTNFQKPQIKRRLKTFMNKYEKKLEIVNNPYLSQYHQDYTK